MTESIHDIKKRFNLVPRPVVEYECKNINRKEVDELVNKAKRSKYLLETVVYELKPGLYDLNISSSSPIADFYEK